MKKFRRAIVNYHGEANETIHNFETSFGSLSAILIHESDVGGLCEWQHNLSDLSQLLSWHQSSNLSPPRVIVNLTRPETSTRLNIAGKGVGKLSFTTALSILTFFIIQLRNEKVFRSMLRSEFNVFVNFPFRVFTYREIPRKV